MNQILPISLTIVALTVIASCAFFFRTSVPDEPSAPQENLAPVSASHYKSAVTTVFWAGEGATAENDFISNSASFWDESWTERYGGYDDPECRIEYHPCGFKPRENPFYVALPFADYFEGAFKESAKMVPWFSDAPLGEPLLKNRWVEVRVGKKSCFGQWEDVGPNGEDDFAYVFGDAAYPKNTFGEKAGIDVSPAMRDCLGIDGSAIAMWRFTDKADVPEGPWKDTVTESGVSWLSEK